VWASLWCIPVMGGRSHMHPACVGDCSSLLMDVCFLRVWWGL
jgi:hypothetical protein